MHCGKGQKDRVVYISNDANQDLVRYLRLRPPSRSNKLFLADKGPYTGKPISVNRTPGHALSDRTVCEFHIPKPYDES